MSAYTDAVARELEGLEGVSTGICPGCRTCQEQLGFKSMRAFKRAYEQGGCPNDGGFSWHPCTVCGSRLGGDREPLHYILNRRIQHSDGACVDCVMYLANGDEPETWSR